MAAGGAPPLVVAHRACPLHAAENSLEGIRAAAALGAGAVEVDVRVTRDGVPVLVHDALLRRTTGRWLPVRAVRAASLRTMALRRGAGEAPPTLASALAALPPTLEVVLDVKVPAALRPALAVAASAGASGRLQVWSQHESVVEAAAAAGVRQVALLRDTSSVAATLRLLDRAAGLGATAVSLHAAAADAAMVEAGHERGLLVYSWATAEGQISALVAAGVDGVVSDFVETAVAAVAAVAARRAADAGRRAGGASGSGPPAAR